MLNRRTFLTAVCGITLSPLQVLAAMEPKGRVAASSTASASADEAHEKAPEKPKEVTKTEPKQDSDQVKAKEKVKPGTKEADKKLVLTLGKSTYELPKSAPAGVQQKVWDDFLRHIASGGKWTLVMYYSDKHLLQTALDVEGLKAVKQSLVSGPSGSHFYPSNKHPKDPHGHLGMFSVPQNPAKPRKGEFLPRDVNHWSDLYECAMPHSLFYLRGHAIHATKLTNQLGRPASHGCTRNSPSTAKWRFQWVRNDPYYIWVVDSKELSQVFAIRTTPAN